MNARLSFWLRVLAGSTLALIATVLVHRFFGFPTEGVDDANISLVYARNLAAGYGLVFTPGFERVEGFSSLLWTLVCAGGFALRSAPEQGLLALSAGLALVCALVVVELANMVARRGDSAPNPLAPVCVAAALGWLAVIPAFWAWTTTTLMDVALFAALVHLLALVLAKDLAGVWGARRSALSLAAVCSGLVLTRPEAMALVPAALLGAAALRASEVGVRAAARRSSPVLLIAAGVLMSLVVFRLVYFGFPFPNTYYAKVSSDRIYSLHYGWRYLLAWWDFQPLSLPLALATFAALAHGLWLMLRRTPLSGATRAALAVSGIVALGLLLPLYVGGDHFGSFRFLQPFAPLLIVPALHGLVTCWPRERMPGRRAQLVTLAILLAAFASLGSSALATFAQDNHLRAEFGIAAANRRLGRALGEAFPDARPAIGTAIAGGIAYAYPGRIADLMGLNWVAMGHSPGGRRGSRNHAAFDLGVFWSDPPDLVSPKFVRGAPTGCTFVTEFENRILHDLDRSARFRREYVAGYVPLEQRVVGGFVRIAWAQRVRPAGLRLVTGEAAHCHVDWDEHPVRKSYEGADLQEMWNPIWQ